MAGAKQKIPSGSDTHSYCLGKVFLAFAIAQDATDVEKCGILATIGLL